MSHALRALCLLLLSGLAWGQPAAQERPPVAAVDGTLTAEQQRSERERLAQARAAQQARWAEREQDCGRKFWANDCLRQAKLEHRRAMSEIDRQQTRFESDIRQRRASEVAERIQSRTQDRTEPPVQRDQPPLGAQQHSAAAAQTRPESVQPQPDQQQLLEPVQQQVQQQVQRQQQRQIQAGERLLKQEQRQEQAVARAQRREQSAQAAQAAQAARLERYAQRAAASDEAPP